jgi:hypothetical protein
MAGSFNIRKPSWKRPACLSQKCPAESKQKSCKGEKKYHFCQLLMKRNEEDTSSKQKTSSIKTSLSLLTVIFYGSF